MIETPRYDLTMCKVHFGLLTLKAYTKGERVLRFEAITHNTKHQRGQLSGWLVSVGAVSGDQDGFSGGVEAFLDVGHDLSRCDDLGGIRSGAE